ncbi:MAG: hypothetical protein IRY91_00240 [Gemmatimonadaceae bacterium]|nr:hypothetical protein [Gemmatimonadaceae bacterium]
MPSIRRPRRSRLLVAGLLLHAGTLVAPALAAQTRFAWPDDTGDVARYTTVEECLAAVERVRSYTTRWSAVWDDTLPLTPERATAPLPDAVVGTARRCGARFAAVTAPVTDFAPLLQLYLLADRDTDAMTIVRRRLERVPRGALRERAAVLDSAVRGLLLYSFGGPGLRAQPARRAVAESLLVEANRLPDSVWSTEARAVALIPLLGAAERAGDTAMVQRTAQRYLDILAGVPPALRRAPIYLTGRLIGYAADVIMNEAALEDSLRRGTAPYVALQRALWARASSGNPDAPRFAIGEPAPRVEGDFWFGRDTTAAPRPTPGKVGLVVYLDSDCRDFSLGACWPAYAALHRLAQRFPTLEVTLMARTHGFFSRMAPPTPAEEAQALHEWWQEFHHLPGALAVTTTAFTRVEAPDRRRIDRPVANETHYAFGGRWSLLPGMAFLVDPHGIIIDGGVLGQHDVLGVGDVELHLARYIEILLRQQTASD